HVANYWNRLNCTAEATCSGRGNLKANDEIWRRASNMWKTKDGQTTYCSVVCEAGTTLTHKHGDTYYCKPDPVNCQQIRDDYDLIPHHSWGTTPNDKKAIWSANNCDDKVIKVDCQFLANHHGIVAGKSWGTAPWHVANYWNKKNCGEW
ncbi:MAG: hypothetical protein ACO3NE_12770, partial [Alphaproteobacteria bacterium]